MLRLLRVPGLILLFLLLGAVRADDPAVSEARLLQDLTYLTSDECEGRGIWTKGIQLAADHIAREFAKAGLKPAGDRGTYFQHFPVTASSRVDKPATLVLTGPLGQTITLEPEKGFTVQRPSGSGKADASLVFVGYGITSKKHNYDDYAGLDVKGKIVIALRRAPRFASPAADPFAADVTHDSGDFRDDAKAANAEAHGAAGLILVNAADVLGVGEAPSRFGPRGDTLTPSPRASSRLTGEAPLFVNGLHVAAIPVIQVRRLLLDDMLRSQGDDLTTLEKEIDASFQPRSRPLPGWRCRLETSIVHHQTTVKNIIGVLEGSGPLADETVVIGAHYDHVGYGMSFPFRMVSGFGDIGAFGAPSLKAGAKMIHYGADDNASGTVSVIELARRFAAVPERRGRRLVFIAFTAEESGLIGSAYYTRHPAFPLEKTVAMLNMDMVGRLQDDHIEITGVGTAKGLEEMVDRLTAKHRLKVMKVRTGFGPSDHESFARRGVPAMELFTGFHEQYHMPTDRVETINIPGLRRVVDLGADIVSEWRTIEPRPQYVKETSPYHRRTALWALTSSFGVVPHPTDHKGGVLVKDVLEETAAARAGIKAGDRIVALGGQAAEDLQTYLRIVRALPPGEKVDVILVRGERPQKIVVELAKLNFAQTAASFGIVPDPAAKDGLRLQRVTANSTAERAGLKPGDRIVAIAGKPATSLEAMRHLLGLNPGDRLELAYEREGKVQKVTATLAFDPTGALGASTIAARPAPTKPGTPMRQVGVSVARTEAGDGARVTRVAEGSTAATSGLRVDDIITAIADKPIKSAEDYLKALGNHKDGDSVEFVVKREGKTMKFKVVLRLVESRLAP